MDCSEHEELCQGVRGYPTIKLFAGSALRGVEFSGRERNAKTISKWAMDTIKGSPQLLTQVTQLRRRAQLEDALVAARASKARVLFVFFTEKYETSPAVISLAHAVRSSASLAEVRGSNEALMHEFGIKADEQPSFLALCPDKAPTPKADSEQPTSSGSLPIAAYETFEGETNYESLLKWADRYKTAQKCDAMVKDPKFVYTPPADKYKPPPPPGPPPFPPMEQRTTLDPGADYSKLRLKQLRAIVEEFRQTCTGVRSRCAARAVFSRSLRAPGQAWCDAIANTRARCARRRRSATTRSSMSAW